MSTIEQQLAEANELLELYRKSPAWKQLLEVTRENKRLTALAGLAMRAFDYYENTRGFSNEDDEFWEQFEADVQGALTASESGEKPHE